MHATNTTVCFNAPDDCDDVVDFPMGHIMPCKGLNPCPEGPTYKCGPDYQCEGVPPGDPPGPYHDLKQCEDACHPPAAAPL